MSIALIQSVARDMLILPSDIIGRSRLRYLVDARSLAVVIMRDRYGMTYPAIGKRLDGRDHSSIIHLYRHGKLVMEKNESYAELVTRYQAAPRLVAAVDAFVPRVVFDLNPRITNQITSQARRAEMARRAWEAGLAA